MESLTPILKRFLKIWGETKEESIDWTHPKTKVQISLNMGSYNPYQIIIEIPDATPFHSNCKILKSIVNTLTGYEAEAAIGLDDYDEINYNVDIQTGEPNWEGDEPTVPITATISYTLIR